jgi:hypothetical protein
MRDRTIVGQDTTCNDAYALFKSWTLLLDSNGGPVRAKLENGGRHGYTDGSFGHPLRKFASELSMTGVDPDRTLPRTTQPTAAHHFILNFCAGDILRMISNFGFLQYFFRQSQIFHATLRHAFAFPRFR